MPSRGEGFGLVYLEAMQHGKPCIGAEGSVAEEVIDHGKTGLLVNPDSEEELAGAICTLLEDDSLRLGMGRAARQCYLQHFTAEAFAERVMGAITEELDCENHICAV